MRIMSMGLLLVVSACTSGPGLPGTLWAVSRIGVAAAGGAGFVFESQLDPTALLN